MTAMADTEVVYDIHLQPGVPDSLRSEFPTMLVRTTGARTVLRLQVDEPDQLAAVLEKLRSVGAPLIGLHRTAEPDPERGVGATYELWVAGELGDSLRWYLRCASHVVPEQTQVRVALKSARLQRFLRACVSCGASIDRVRRVDPVAQPAVQPVVQPVVQSEPNPDPPY
jgi:hypothetical protein